MNGAPKQSKSREGFRKFAHNTSQIVGSPGMFIIACLVIIAWALTGPIFQFSDTWQLVINTGTTIVTFLMVFLIQNTQNRDTRAIHLKLDELIRAMKGARNKLVNLEEMSDEELDKLQAEFERVCGVRRGKKDGPPDTQTRAAASSEPVTN
jgi:low affinity Fe/Cu permease